MPTQALCQFIIVVKERLHILQSKFALLETGFDNFLHPMPPVKLMVKVHFPLVSMQ